MLLFGHLGLGSNIVSPLAKGLPRRPLLLGTLLPDLIDKPLYYGMLFLFRNLDLAQDLTQSPGAQLPLVHGTRSFGHTALFVLILTFAAILKRSRILAALSLGVSSHLLIDSFSNENFHLASSLLWPWGGFDFPHHRYHQMSDYYSFILNNPVILGGELTGIVLFFGQYGREVQRSLKNFSLILKKDRNGQKSS